MALVEINWQPTRTDLRVFGGAFAVFCAVVGGLCYQSDGQFGLAESLFSGMMVLVVLLSLFAPRWLRPAYFVFIVAAFPIGWVVSHVLLAVVFYGVFWPIGLVMRLWGRDPMRRRFDPDAESYWAAHAPRKPLEDYFRQF